MLAAEHAQSRDDPSPPEIVNVAATCVGTATLGPGWRSVVWVQGCPFRCAACLAPDWIPIRAARVVDAAALADELLADPSVTGLTLSGGEPMLQAKSLAEVVRVARERRDLSVVCFTGYTLEDLRRRSMQARVGALLDQVDVLIDGQYVAAANAGRGLRGSSNQRVHHLTSRLISYDDDLTLGARKAEIRVTDRNVLLVGVPPPGVVNALDRAFDRLRLHEPRKSSPTNRLGF